MTELRLHPRISSELQATISNDAGDRANTRIRNLSPGGLMVEADPDLKQLVFKGHEQDKDPLFNPIEMDIWIELPNQIGRFHSRARLLYVRRLSQNAFEMGLRYVAISAVHAQMMEQYVFGSQKASQHQRVAG